MQNIAIENSYKFPQEANNLSWWQLTMISYQSVVRLTYQKKFLKFCGYLL